MSWRRSARLLPWALVLTFLVPAFLAPPAPRGRTPGARLFGPFLELAARLEWLRFQRAHLRGEEVRALELAARALELDPRNTRGWETLGSHLALFLASEEREPDLERRRLWFRSGLEVLQRGAERAADPAALELARGLLLVSKAELDPALDPGGAGALYREAAQAFERAEALGSREAAGLSGYALERAGSGRP